MHIALADDDNRMVMVDEDLACKFSATLADQREDLGPDQIITLKRVTLPVFSAMVDWWKHHDALDKEEGNDADVAAEENVADEKTLAETKLTDWDRAVFFSRYSAAERAAVLCAADYIRSNRLFQQCCAMEAESIKGKNVAQIALQLNVHAAQLRGFTPQQLAEMEAEFVE
jgi:hypothetical protein